MKNICFSNNCYNLILEKFPSIVSFHNYLDNLASDFYFYYSFYYQKVVARSIFSIMILKKLAVD